jgi:hypothetical protein
VNSKGTATLIARPLEYPRARARRSRRSARRRIGGPAPGCSPTRGRIPPPYLGCISRERDRLEHGLIEG